MQTYKSQCSYSFLITIGCISKTEFENQIIEIKTGSETGSETGSKNLILKRPIQHLEYFYMRMIPLR